MTSRLGLIALVVAGTAVACAKPADETAAPAEGTALSAADSTKRAADVAALVARHVQAMETGNAALLDSLSAPHLVHVNAAGQSVTEQELLEKIRGGAKGGYEIVSINTRVVGGDVVVVNAQLKEKATSKLHHLTQVWVINTNAPVAAAYRNSKGTNRFVTLASRHIRFAQDTYDDSSVSAAAALVVSSHSSSASESSDDASADASVSATPSAQYTPGPPSSVSSFKPY